MKVHKGHLDASRGKFAIVVSRFNEFVTQKLLEGALDCLQRHGAKEENLEVIWVPGAFEIPYAAKRIADSKSFHGIICLGAVIRGATPHFDYVASEVAKGVARVALDSGVPTVYGVVTADTIEQAVERAGAKTGNRGFDAALATIELVDLFAKIPRGRKRS
jgi:6,7-dimethyl-8-ribityllumazine synthase